MTPFPPTPPLQAEKQTPLTSSRLALTSLTRPTLTPLMRTGVPGSMPSAVGNTTWGGVKECVCERVYVCVRVCRHACVHETQTTWHLKLPTQTWPCPQTLTGNLTST